MPTDAKAAHTWPHYGALRLSNPLEHAHCTGTQTPSTSTQGGAHARARHFHTRRKHTKPTRANNTTDAYE